MDRVCGGVDSDVATLHGMVDVVSCDVNMTWTPKHWILSLSPKKLTANETRSLSLSVTGNRFWR